MSRALTAVGALVLLGGCALWLLWGGAGERRPGGPGDPGGPDHDGPGAATPRDPAAGGALARPGPPPEFRTPVDLADEPTAFLEIVDSETGAAVAGAAVHRFHRGAPEAAIAFSDDRGVAAVPLEEPGQLVVVHEGHLLRIAPTRPGSTATQPQRVQLVPDRYSHRVAVRFALPDGGTPTEVRATFRPDHDDPSRDTAVPMAVQRGADVVRRAWSEHTTVAAVQAVPDVHLQAGRFNADRVHLLGGEATVWFLEPGAHRYAAATEAGFAARGTFEVERAGQQGLVVRLQPGRELAGVVRTGRGGTPVADARVAVARGDPLHLTATTGADGRFRLWPLAPGQVDLEVRHRDYEPAALPGQAVGADNVAVELTPLPGGMVRGRVVVVGPAGSRAVAAEPVAGAVASVQDSLGQPVTARADADGWFALSVPGDAAVRLTVGAEGFLPHVELVEPGAAGLEFALWPGATEERLRRGLTGVVEGVVVDEQGRPVAGCPVRFVPDRAAPMPDLGGRRVLQGGAGALPTAATTTVDGSFELETTTGGSGMIVVADGPQRGQGAAAGAVLGRRMGGVRVRIRR